MGYPEYIQYSIDLLRRAERLALKMQPERGFWLAFSGGKDSQCIYHLAKLAGVKFEAHYAVTTLDHPELVHFIRRCYPDVIWNHPKRTFLQLCLYKKMLPTMQARFCCQELKESAGAGHCTIIGVRKAESSRRAKREELERVHKDKAKRKSLELNEMEEQDFQCVGGKDKITLAPILHWTDEQVWHFLNDVVKVEHCELYDQGYHRLGCMFCPMSSEKSIRKDETRFPKWKENIIKTIHKLREGGFAHDYQDLTDEEIYEWWVSKRNMKEWYYDLKYQGKLFE